MKEKRTIVANWKMNKTIEECNSFVDKFMNMLLEKPKSKVIFCPPFSALFYMAGLMKDTPYGIGAQNIHWHEEGAYTGEISGKMLISCGATYVIIGHSERRQLFGDSDELINKRLHAALANGLTPIMCIGETLEDRKDGKTLNVIREQLHIGLNGINVEQMGKIIYAYEPVWAIGTGERAEPHMINEVHMDIRKVISELGNRKSNETTILYGGSVNKNNVKELLKLKEVDGYLIGGSSLDVDEFVSIIQQSEET